jgi:hypothetical protein
MAVEVRCRNTPGQLSAAYRVEHDLEADLVRCFHRSSSESGAAEIDVADDWPSVVVTDQTD